MKKKLIIGLVVLLAVGGFAAKTILLKPKPVKMKVAGQVYVLPHQFTLNLADGRYATITAALVLGAGQSDGSSATASAPSADSVVGTLPEEAVIRDLITNIITGVSSQTLTSATGREHIKQEILAAIRANTDDKIDSVLFPDVAVQ
jgi:flagellar FliL protein